MNVLILRKRRWNMLLGLLVSLGATSFLIACQGGGGDASDSDGSGGFGGSRGLAGSGNSEEAAIESDALLDSVVKAAAMSDEDLSAALAAADLDAQTALADPSGLMDALDGEAPTRSALAGIGTQMQIVVDEFASGVLFGDKKPLSYTKRPGVRVQAEGEGSLSEAFGAGWLGGSLFNAHFVQTVISDYSSGKSGLDTSNSPSGDVFATGFISDTKMTLDAIANFSLNGLTAKIQTQSGIPCPDVNGLMTVNSSLEVTAKASNTYQDARFSFELIVEVDDDAKLTGKNQLKSTTQAHTADSRNGYEVTDRSVDVSVTEFSDGDFGDAKGKYEGMTEKEAQGWLNAALFSGEMYRRQLLPHLQKMLDAGRCVGITVEPSDGPLNLDPLANVDLLTMPRAKISNTSEVTGGTVQAKFKKNAGGAIVESGSKVPADATFHYIAPLDFKQTEVVTFEARSRRGTGKLDYTLTTSPHAD